MEFIGEQKMKKIDTLLFDLDGTLLDTNELIISSFLHTMETHFPGEYDREKVMRFYGGTLEDSFGSVAKDEAMTMEMVKTYRTFNLDKHDEMAVAFDGVYEVLEKLHNAGYKMAIVTSKKLDSAIRGLKLIDIEKFFDVVVSADCVQNHKPHHEPVEMALEKLGKAPDVAMMVGDNYHDIESGHSAGTKTVCVSWTIHDIEKMKSYHPDFIIETMHELLNVLAVE